MADNHNSPEFMLSRVLMNLHRAGRATFLINAAIIEYNRSILEIMESEWNGLRAALPLLILFRFYFRSRWEFHTSGEKSNFWRYSDGLSRY